MSYYFPKVPRVCHACNEVYLTDKRLSRFCEKKECQDARKAAELKRDRERFAKRWAMLRRGTGGNTRNAKQNLT